MEIISEFVWKYFYRDRRDVYSQ